MLANCRPWLDMDHFELPHCSASDAETWIPLVRAVVNEILTRRADFTSDLREDCLLEGNIAVWLALPRADLLPPAHRPRYLAVCIRNCVKRVLKRETRQRCRALAREESADDLERDESSGAVGERYSPCHFDLDTAHWDLGDERLNECLAGLSSHTRETLRLHFGEELSYSEISARLGGQSGAYKMVVSRAVARLRASVAAGSKAQAERERGSKSPG